IPHQKPNGISELRGSALCWPLMLFRTLRRVAPLRVRSLSPIRGLPLPLLATVAGDFSNVIGYFSHSGCIFITALVSFFASALVAGLITLQVSATFSGLIEHHGSAHPLLRIACCSPRTTGHGHELP